MEKSPQNTPDSEQERCELSVPEASQRKTYYVGWDMANRILKRLIIPAILVAVFSTQSVGDELKSPLERHARKNTQAADYDRDVGLSEESGLPARLKDLSTSLPEEVVAESPQAEDLQVENLQKELESTVSTNQAAVPEETNPLFAKPSDIPPLYTSPELEGEGIWTAEYMPSCGDGPPLVYKTVYRPSEEFPTSTVYMALFDMNRLRTRLFIGQTEPGFYQVSDRPEEESLSKIVAITNAMWMQQHARGAGAIFRGQVIYPMVPGMATMVIYRDDSVDVLEWTDEIPLSVVRDARQLRHLIVKDGMVVEKVVKNGKITDAELGLGGLLIPEKGRSTRGNKFWFLATRTAFGIRDDGNVVFAMGHHVSTRDLAKALVLAGCKRAIHGDANIHNTVCNFYFRNEREKIVKRDKLSPEQLQYTLKRYDQGYAKDFFAFYEK
jgi:hypothetical protein